ncbi:MAG: hypothetical protein RIS64_2592 [Bacteroidota bacterium]|jgi:hypothetical protein
MLYMKNKGLNSPYEIIILLLYAVKKQHTFVSTNKRSDCNLSKGCNQKLNLSFNLNAKLF